MAHHQPNQPTKLSEATSTADNAPIPPLTTIAPTIFVPLKVDDLLAPHNQPTSRIEQLQAKLHALEQNRRRVRANMLTLYRREAMRLLQDAHEMERQEAEQNGGKPPANGDSEPAVSEQDLEDMIANITAEVPAGGDRRRTGEPPVSLLMPPNFANVVPRSAREHCTQQLMITLGQGLIDLRGYEDHVAAIRKEYTDAINREMKVVMQME